LGAGQLVSAETGVAADGITGLQRDEWFPARNLTLIAAAAIMLGREGGGQLWLGASELSYRDTRPAFFAAAEQAVRESLPESVPFMVVVPKVSRLELLRAAVAEGLEPRMTFSCNRRSDRHCWRCASCRDRAALLGDLRMSPTPSERSPTIVSDG
jgi:7-cyano-7-deazaguanine synthase in queuosine biosynthesis